MLIDSHCHLADEAFVPDLDAVIGRAQAAGLEAAVCILQADDEAELVRAEGVRERWPAVRFVAGIHPHRAGPYGGRAADAVAAVEAAARRMQTVAIGEIGLDYHYDFAPRDAQREVFAAQVELALAVSRPVVIHTREATADTMAVLREHGAGKLRGVLHCFSGTLEDAKLGLEIGFYISLSGILTFPKAGALRDVARYVPADRLLVETDAPYLAPVPYRGKRNEPAFVAETLARLAAERGTAPEAMRRQIAENFAALFVR